MLSDSFIEKSQLTQPDSRWGSFVVVKREGRVERMDFDRWYDAVAKTECRFELSERMRKRVFEIKNLLVYSWFVYSFASTAFLMSVLLVEAYMKETGILKQGQALGNFVNNHKQNQTLPEDLLKRLEGLVSLRNRYAHENVALQAPGSMLMSVQSSLDIIAALHEAHG